ncbi:hypothetical protein FJ251_07690 [bacterium]|nr:hypothetical protein [bacterium]
MRRAFLSAVLASGLLGLGCGGDGGGPAGPGNNNNGGGSSFTAVIDGSNWTSSQLSIQLTGDAGNPQASPLVISGYENASGFSVQLFLGFIGGTGSYPLGVNAGSTAGGTAQVVLAPDIWLTPFSGAAGNLEVTTLTATRIAGTFAFTADALLSALPAQRSVTSGAFDITVSTGLPALPTRAGSTMRATTEGSAWNGATIVALNPGAGTFSLSGSSTDYTFMVTPKQLVAAGNSYGIPSQITFTVNRTGTADSWAAISGADVGTWTIDSFTAAGMSGSFSGTIPSLSAGTPLTITGGEYACEF